MKKRISDTTLERLNAIEPSALVAAGLIERVAKESNFEVICPCGNGGGNDATGIEPKKMPEGYWAYNCLRCGDKFNNISLIRALKSVGFVEACKMIADVVGCNIEYDNGDIEYHARKRSAEVKEQLRVKPEHEHDNDTSNSAQDNAADIGSEGNADKATEVELIQKDLYSEENIKDLKDFCKKNGGKWRGLPLEILRRHNCVLDKFWAAPSMLLKKGANVKTSRRVLIPCDETLSAYLARSANPNTSKNEMPKIHCGSKKLFFSDKDILNDSTPVFVTEGYIDAMSIEFAGFKAVALGGVAGSGLLLDYLKEKAVRPKLILLLDSDKSGKTAAPKLRDALTKMKIPTVIKFLQREGESEKIDCNEILQNQGRNALRQRLREIFNDSTGEFERLDKEIFAQDKTDKTQSVVGSEGNKGISERRQKLLQLLESKEPKNKFTEFEIYAGNFEDKDFATRIERFAGRYIKWLEEESTWLTYRRYKGVWFKSKRYSNADAFKYAVELSDFLDKNAGESDFKKKVSKEMNKAKTVTGAFTYLRGFKSIRISEKDLDIHPELLNCSNCVIDLTTGKSYQQRPELLLTQRTAAEYNPKVDTAQVMKFFEDIQPNEETRAALLRWLGYCITAETSADKFAIFTGSTGCNGKSTLSTFVLKTLGEDYSTTMTADAIALRRKRDNANAATTALNVVEGRRFGVVEEISSTMILDSSTIKTLSGGDRLSLRRNYGEFKTIDPSIKLNISGNYMPKLESIIDGGLLRRLLNFNFGVKFGTPEHPMDEHLMDRLLQRRNKSALLKILVEQARQWYCNGLIISKEMYQTRDRHLAENDFVRSYVKENGIGADEGKSITAKKLLEDLKDEYPAECSRFKRADLIKMIEETTGAKYTPIARRPAQFVGISRNEKPESK